MAKAARAIIIEDGKLLVMFRNKHGTQYYTLVGGRVDPNETTEEALLREVKEETGLQITHHQLVFIEDHPEPYNQQYIYLCQVAPHEDIAIQDYAEEGMMNKLGMNVHKPVWAVASALASLPFRTPHLQQAIVEGIKKGFPSSPKNL